MESQSKWLFENLNNEKLQKLEIDEIKEILKPLMDGLVVKAPIIPQGSYLYRGRELGSKFSKANGIGKKDLIHPESNIAKLGRANRQGHPIFYCSLSKEPIFFELSSLVNDSKLIVSFWKTKTDMIVNNIGYTQYLFEKLGATRACPTWTSKSNHLNNTEEINVNDNAIPEASKKLAYSHDKNRTIREAMGNAFMCYINSENAYMYKLTVAITELHLGKIAVYPHQIAGIMYPSIRVDANGG